MKKAIFLFVMASILISSVSVMAASNYYVGTSDLRAMLVNQDPISAEPGGYVNLLFKIENMGTTDAKNVIFELLPKYPFSLDPGVSAVQELGIVRGIQSGSDAFLLRYKVKVDENAVNGLNEIDMKYSEGTTDVKTTKQTINVSVENPKADFDVIYQDSTAPSVTLAITNIGDNAASAVIVKIPDQQNFRVTGASGSVIGNLNAADYTLVTFQLTPVNNASSMGRDKNLTVEVSYTDILGIRRTVDKEVTIPSSTGTGILRGTISRTQTSGNNGMTYAIIGIVGIIIIVVLLKSKAIIAIIKSKGKPRKRNEV